MSEWRTPSLYVEFGAQSLDGHAAIPATFYDAGRRLFNACINPPLQVRIIMSNALPLFDQRVGIGRLFDIHIEANTAVEAPSSTQ